MKKTLRTQIPRIAAALLATVLLTAASLHGSDREVTPFAEPARNETLTETFLPWNSTDSRAIGCILPLTGRYAAYGKRALDAVSLAAGIFDPRKRTDTRLIIEDSGGDPDISRAAVEKLVRKSRVVCILGPLGVVEAQSAAAEAQRLEVPILVMTQKEGITETGSFVFRNFLTNRMQVRTLANYAVNNLGLRRFAVLYPQDANGHEMVRLFRAEIQRLGGQIRKVKAYDKAETDFGAEIRFITGRPRPHSVGFGKDQRTEPPPEAPPVDFDALFIPDVYGRVQMIAPQLAFHDVKGVQLLGSSGWNSPELLKTGARHLEGALFVDDFFPGSFHPELNDFTDAFYAAFGREPDGMDATWFDAAGIAVSIVDGGRAETRQEFRERLAGLRSYPGVTGKTSFFDSRDADKELYLLQVQEGRIVQIR